jgi:thioredoxin 1
METQVTSNNFETEVLKASLPVLVDFWAPWCGPCKMIAPAIEELARESVGKLKVCKINVDEAQDLATKFSVMSIPTLMVFKAGKVMEKKVGGLRKADIIKFMAPYI